MSTNITLKRSSVQGKVPVVGDLALGEIALNTYDGKLFIKKNVGGTESIVDVTASGATNLALTSNSSTVSVSSDTGTDVTILAANATTAGVLTADAQTIAGVKTFIGTLTVDGTNGELLRLSVTSNASIQQTFGLGFATGSTSTNPAALISAEEFDASDSRAALTFSTRDTNSDIAPTERMRIDSSGSVLIGNTTSRGSRFEVERTDNNNGIADFKTNNASGDVIIRSSGGLVRVRAQGTNDMALMTSGTVRMLIAANSNVGIANTAPAQTLTVDGTVGGTIIATQAEAEAGSSTTKLMTPERVLQSLALNAIDGINVRTFTTTAQSPYIPTTGMKYCLVIATGGGAGGGGSDCGDSLAAGAGGGGGAGGTAIKYYTAAQIGVNAAFAVGGGGTAGSASGGDGGAGGTTTFTPSGGGAALSATGGTLGNGSGQPTTGAGAIGGVGGTPTGGDLNITGGDAGSGAGHTNGGFAIAGSGGNSFWGGGGRGMARVSTTSIGQPGGTNTGGGGGGSATIDSTTGSAGGAGGSGVIFILEFI